MVIARTALTVMAVLALLVGSAKPAAAQASFVQIGFVVLFQNPSSLIVSLTVECDPANGPEAVAFAMVTQNTPPNVAEADGAINVVCDGTKHTVAVNIIGAGFQLGPAAAVAELCNAVCAMDQRPVTVRLQ